MLIITSWDLSSPAKTKALDLSKNRSLGVNITWWNKYDLTKLLFSNPDIKRLYQLSPISAPSLKVGVLSGYINNPSIQTRCNSAFSELTPEEWVTLFQRDNVESTLVNLDDITEEYDAIINPFGEIYPEKDHNLRTTYKTFLDYIENGGIFVGTGGFPFYYLYDFQENDHRVTTSPTINLIDLRTGRPQGYFAVKDIQFCKDFDVIIDTSGIREISIIQHESDKRYVGDLCTQRAHYTIFRSLVNQRKDHIIPFIRDETDSIFPMAAIEHGFGFYIHSGFHTHNREAQLISSAVLNWLRSASGRTRALSRAQ